MTDASTPEISTGLVRELVRQQFPRWAGLAVTPVAEQGWDNRTFRLGDELAVRLPSAAGYVAGVAKEDRWLPVLAGRLPLPVPVPVATGAPGSGYPFPFSVRRWLPGETLTGSERVDRTALARALGEFLVALRAAPTGDAPAAGAHSFFRGSHPSVYTGEVDTALARLGGEVDGAACRKVWAQALASRWSGAPVWFHGDIATGNLLVRDGRLAAVIDFGTCGVGDPACDLVLAWTYLGDEARAVFRAAVALDADTWRRARGWALWKALVTLTGLSSPAPPGPQHRTLAAVLADPVLG